MSSQQNKSTKTHNPFTYEKPLEQLPSSQGSSSPVAGFGNELRKVGSEVAAQTSNVLVGTIPDMLRSIMGQPILQVDMDPAKRNQEAQMWKKRYQMKEMQRQQETAQLARKEQEQTQRVEQLRNELRMVTVSVSKFAHEAEQTVFQAPADAGTYHEHFFTQLLSFLKSLRRRINKSRQWMAAHNARSSKKKGLWGIAQTKKGHLKVDTFASNERSSSFGG